jgi:hypothetical protein
MIIAIVLIVLLLTTWLYIGYLSWLQSKGVRFEPIERSDFLKRYAWLERLVRRSWYSARAEGKKMLLWSGKQAESAITTVFPRSEAAFKKPNELTGLQTGPSSYFLKQISPETAKTPRSSRSKKVV